MLRDMRADPRPIFLDGCTPREQQLVKALVTADVAVLFEHPTAGTAARLTDAGPRRTKDTATAR